MNELIIERWNSDVGVNDHTFIIGDVAMGQIVLAPPLIRRLNGHKTLIRGNHDKTLVKLPEFNSLFIDAHDYLEQIVVSTMVCMSHFPMASWNGMAKGAIMLHGHLHGAEVQVIDAVNKRIKDVGIDTNTLYVYNLEELVEEMKKIPLPTFNHHGREL